MRAPMDAGTDHEDLVGVGMEGLQWLVNAPKVNGIVIAEDGMPLRCWSVDPRAFALHKVWLSERPDREPLKRGRDQRKLRMSRRSPDITWA